MHPILYVSSWPSALETLKPREHHNIGWISGAHDESLSQVLDALAAMPLGAWRIYLLGGEETLPTETDPRVTPCDLRTPEAGSVVANLDVAVLPAEGLLYWREVLENWAIPPVVLSKLAGGGSLNFTAEPGDIAGITTNIWLLLTDPPSRRCGLDRLRCSSAKADAEVHWRIEGVFDSSYSLALVNRHLAMAMCSESDRRFALLTYEQGSPPSFSLSKLSPLEQESVGELWANSSKFEGAPEIAFRNAWPPTVQGMRGYLRVLANYAWEETRFPREFAMEFNRTLDLITVVSHQTARFLEDAGVNVPIAVVGNGADHLKQKEPSQPPVSLPDGFRFLHVSSCFARKGLDVILGAFGEAFSGDNSVSLVIKTFPNPHNDVLQQVAQFEKRHPDGPVVAVFEDDWTDGEIAGLYRACHAYVAPSRGEGFGLPLAEAMLHRLPVITSDWGGQLDFCSEENSWLVPSNLVSATTHLSQPGSLWAEPDQTALANILKLVRDAAERGPKSRHARALELRKKLNNAEKQVAALTWSSVAVTTMRAINAVVAQPAPLPSTRLGWVSTWGERCGVASYSDYMTAPMQPGGRLSAQCELLVLAPADEVPTTPDPDFVHRCWQRGATSESQSQLIRHLLKWDVDAVVIQYHWGFFAPPVLVDTIRALSVSGVGVILDMHNTRSAPEQIHADFNFIHGLGYASRILVHTQEDVSRLEGWGLRDNVSLFPLATYPVPLPEENKLATLRSELGLDGKKVIASYGFLMAHKGIAELLEAMPLILSAEPTAHLLLVNAVYSDASSGQLKEQICAAIHEMGIAEHVTFIAEYLPDSESMAMLKLADVVAFPYQRSEESSSAAARMAISGRCPVAITPIPIFADIAPACSVLPGVSAPEIAAGLVEVLSVSSDPDWRAEQASSIDALAGEMDANELSARLLGMIQGCLRRVKL